MPKVVLTEIGNLSNGSSLTAINDNFDAIESALENTVSRDGTAPNTLQTDLDVNNKNLINVPKPTSDLHVVRKGDVVDIVTSEPVVSVFGDTIYEDIKLNTERAVAAADAAAESAAAAAVAVPTALAGYIYDRPYVPANHTTMFNDLEYGAIYWNVDHWSKFSDGTAASLPDFAYETEATSLFSSFAVAPNTRRKKTYNQAIKRLKDAGIWSKIKGLWIDSGVQDELRNWKTGTALTKVGSPSYTAGRGYKATGTGQYFRSGFYLDDFSQNSLSFFFRSEDTSGLGSANYDMGATDSSGYGMRINALSTISRVGVSCGGASVAGGNTASSSTDGQLMFGCSRLNSTEINTYRAGRNIGPAVASTSQAMGHVEITFLTTNSNGTPSTSYSSRQQSAWILANGLTDTEAQKLWAILETFREAINYGKLNIYEPGTQPEIVNVDLAVYGWTPAGAIAAREGIRQGLTVALIGGWRDQIVGGMPAGGLGFTDIKLASSWGGLGRLAVVRCQQRQGVSTSTITFEPREFARSMRGFLDPEMADGADVKLYRSGGVMRVDKPDKETTRIITRDGRQFRAKRYIDASYEGDLLMRTPGVTWTFGREAAGTGNESYNGWRGNTGWNNAARPKISPHVTAGDPSSGLLPGIQGVLPTTLAIGDAMPNAGVQAYNYRLIITYNGSRKIEFADTPPPGYDAQQYEILLRMFADNPSLSMSDLFSNGALTAAYNIFDSNNNGYFSTDYIGGNVGYLTASYDDREAIVQAHRNWILGFWHTLRQSTDSRLPAPVQTSAKNWGLDVRHFLEPYGTDPINWPTQLYIRAGARPVGDFIYTANDATMAEGSTPRSIKTIGMASYFMDNHAAGRYAYEYSPGQWMMFTEGSTNINTPGDQTVPVPFEAILPKKTECTNLITVFNASATRIGTALLRMEPTSMQMAQSGAIACAISIEQDIPIQDVPYSTLRSRIQAAPTLTDETQIVLNQVN